MVGPSSIAAKLWAPQNAYKGPLIVASKKRFQRYGTSRGRMANKISQFFIFSYFTIFQFHWPTHFRQNRRQKVFMWGLHICAEG